MMFSERPHKLGVKVHGLPGGKKSHGWIVALWSFRLIFPAVDSFDNDLAAPQQLGLRYLAMKGRH